MRDTFEIMPLDLNGEGDSKLNFGVCKRSVNCITLHHGKLYTCSLLPTIKHFNRKFGKNLAITSEDYVNIYDDVSAEEVLRRICQPVPACRYCKLDNKSTRVVKWGISKGDISEWV